MGMIGYFFTATEDSIAQAQNGTVSFYELADSAKGDDSLDIDKTWHAIHFILSGDVWGSSDEDPLSQAVLYGTPVGEDMGCGPAVLKTAPEVRQIAQALSGITREWFRERFHITEMIRENIYPVMDDENEEGFFDYVWAFFPFLQTFYQKAAAEGKCVLFHIS